MCEHMRVSLLPLLYLAQALGSWPFQRASQPLLTVGFSHWVFLAGAGNSGRAVGLGDLPFSLLTQPLQGDCVPLLKTTATFVGL